MKFYERLRALPRCSTHTAVARPKPTLHTTASHADSVISAVACIDATLHRRCVRRWRWLAFVSLWAGFCCADFALGEVHLDWARHLWRYAGVTTAAVCVAVVLELFRVGWS